ncbi:MAG: helix-turn-helix domain-containing protein [Ruminococcaceae bacterium]|nr:helix-turn-helix domain-containing protein [Oscillospiraceae bacterium]
MDFPRIPITTEIDVTGFHSIYYFEFGRTFYHPPEQHDFWEMVYVDDGCIHAISDGIGCSLAAGQIIFHRPMESHAHVADQVNTSNMVVVSFAAEGDLLSFFDRKIFTLTPPSKKILSLFLAEAKTALGELPHDFDNRAPLDFSGAPCGSLQLLQCYLTEFLFSLMRANEASIAPMEQTADTRRMAENSLATAVVQYIDTHLQEPPSLPQLCTHFSVSRALLCRIFREAVGQSPVDYWIHCKMKEARRLIREGQYNITQISELLGYTGIHHFTRMFKRVTGQSPTSYRRSVR